MKIFTGAIFGRWTVVRFSHVHTRPCGGTIKCWVCKCSCGNLREIEAASLIHGRSKSCGHRKYLTGKLNPGWRGGMTKHKAGYIVITGTKKGGIIIGRTLQHIRVMEKFLGRKLFKKETVHHINGCRDDNRIKNLELWASRHPPGQRVKDLIKWAVRLLKRYAPGALK